MEQSYKQTLKCLNHILLCKKKECMFIVQLIYGSVTDITKFAEIFQKSATNFITFGSVETLKLFTKMRCWFGETNLNP